MSACPNCGTTMSFVEGRSEWWCNRCLAARPAAPSGETVEAGSSATPGPSSTREGRIAAEVAEHTVSLVLVLPIAAGGAIACAILVALGLHEISVAVGIATALLVWLAW